MSDSVTTLTEAKCALALFKLAQEHESVIAPAVLEHARMDILKNAVPWLAALVAEVEQHDKSEIRTIEQRDRYEEVIGDLAGEVGCQEEWSNLHSHGACISEGITAVANKAAQLQQWHDEMVGWQPRADRAEREVERLRTAITNWLHFGADEIGTIKAQMRQVLEPSPAEVSHG